MKKKLSFILVLTLAVSMLLTACGGGASSSAPAPSGSGSGSAAPEAKPVTIVFGNYGSSSMPPYFADQDAIAHIEEKSDGSIKYQYSADAVLGGESDMIQQVMDGTIQAATLSTGTFATFTNLTEVFQLPFLLGSYEVEQLAMGSDAAQAIWDKVGADLGLKIAIYQENGIRHFANNKRPIQGLSDLKGLKIRIAPSKMLTEVMTDLGANPQIVAYNDVYSALQNNVIDGEEINITSIYALKHYEVVKYISEIGMYPFPCVVAYNLDFWNSLTAEQQNLILEGHQIGTDNLFKTYLPDYEAKAYEAMNDLGIEINTVSDEARDEFVKIAQPIWDDYYAKDPLIANFIDYVKSISG